MNKRKIICILAFTSIFWLTKGFADKVCTYSPGMVRCGSGAVDSVFSAGIAILNGTTVNNTLTVEGSLKAANANLNQVSCNGSADINNTKINGSATVNGTLTSNNVDIAGNLTIRGLLTADSSNFATLDISSKVTYLKNSNTRDILVHEDNHNEKIYLQDNTTVKGDITFESGNGEVIEEGGTVTGRVIGGKITR